MLKPVWTKVAMILAICAGVFGMQSHLALPALADGSCGPGQNFQQYSNEGCAYATVQPYTISNDGYVYINVYIDPSVSAIQSQVVAGMNAWSNAVNVRFTQVSSAPSANSNGLTITAEYDGIGSPACNTVWGHSWDGGSGDYHVVKLNASLFPYGCSGWPGLVAHEMGHSMGLAHNSYNNGYELMYSSYIKVQTPQSADISVWNSIYEQTMGCTAYASDPECDNQDYIQQGCNDYPQETASNAYISVTLHYSTNCQGNWTSSKILGGGYVIKTEQTQRSGTFGPGQAGPLTYSEYPGGTSWYTNMIWSPNNSVRSCVWYGPSNTQNTYGPVCTGWH